MLITVQDDGVLRIYGSADEAVRDVEALDAEETFRSVFDETGQSYVISWIRQNQRGLFTARNGEYQLVPYGRVDVEALLKVIREVQLVEPESLRSWLRELEGRLTSSSGPA
jgi:hypothetical protein